MTRWWTVEIPADYRDISAQARKAPALVAVVKQRLEFASAVDVYAYRPEGAGLLTVMDTTFPAVVFNSAELERLEQAERESSANFGEEQSYKVEHTKALVVGTQKATMMGGAMTFQKRWTGLGTDGFARMLTVGCTGSDDVCEPILKSVVVDEAQFKTLASLKPVTTTDVGEMVALGAAGVGFLGLIVVMFRRRRKPPAAAQTEDPPAA